MKSIIEDFFEKPPLETIDPNEVVALGAAIQVTIQRTFFLKKVFNLFFILVFEHSNSFDYLLLNKLRTFFLQILGINPGF